MNKNFKKKRIDQEPKKKELVLVFDENARREFLTGFHKRKVQRKTKAREEIEKQLKLERKRIKAQTKQMYNNMIKLEKPIPETNQLITKEIDMGEHYVSVTEVSTADMAKKHNLIGENQVQYQEENKENRKTHYSESEEIGIIGMEMAKKGEMKNVNVKTKKDLKKVIKKEATQHVKNSKIFKTKSRIAQLKNIKRKKREARRKERQSKNCKKGKHKKK